MSDAADRPRAALLPIVLGAVFLVPLGVTGSAIALPTIARDLGTDPTLLQWTVNGFNVAFAVSMIAAGAAADRFGYRITLMLGSA